MIQGGPKLSRGGIGRYYISHVSEEKRIVNCRNIIILVRHSDHALKSTRPFRYAVKRMRQADSFVSILQIGTTIMLVTITMIRRQ